MCVKKDITRDVRKKDITGDVRKPKFGSDSVFKNQKVPKFDGFLTATACNPPFK